MAAVARESASNAGSISGRQTDPSLPVHRLVRLIAQQAAREFINNHPPTALCKASASRSSICFEETNQAADVRSE